MAGDQRLFAARPPVEHLHRAHRRWHASAGYAEFAVLLARLVARRQDPRLLRPAQRRVRHLHHPGDGGEETRLTTAKGLDDGPDYSPDGQYIYFNSERTGRMQIWRMHPDGSAQEQITFDDFNNWFPHISPDGKWMVFLSYEKDVTGHPPNKDVQLRLMNLADGQIKVLAKLFGGQGTINVPSWSPDSLKVAFVSYQLLPGRRS